MKFLSGLSDLSVLCALCVLCVSAGCDRGTFGGNEPADQVWKKTCSRCHGLSGEGTGRLGRALDMRTEAWQSQITDGEIEQTIREGKKGVSQQMQPYGRRLSDEQIKGLVKHIRGHVKGGR